MYWFNILIFGVFSWTQYIKVIYVNQVQIRWWLHDPG